MSSAVTGVILWVHRMSARYGGVVYDHDGNVYDWGQALARECHGLDGWREPVEGPTPSDLERALEWERGDWPAWVAPRPRRGGTER